MMTDFDADGDTDILHTCGDNADYPPVLKPYHGIRILDNDGQNHFSERLFLPLPGAYGAVTADFDGDDDTDLAAVSFFPDYLRQPDAGFVFFESKAGVFVPHTFPFGRKGRWLVLDTADWDGDGDPDLCLGSLAFENREMPALLDDWVREGLPFMLLENRSIR